MPRRHKPTKHTPFHASNNEVNKKRYPSKAAAEKAAEERMLLHPQLKLKVYQSLDGGWYMTQEKA